MFWLLILITPIQTKINAVNVPMLTISAKSPRGINPATIDIKTPVIKIIRTGVLVLLLIKDNFLEIN
jgi:hypothetical protein